MSTIIVIGGGPAGTSAARELADGGHRVTLIEARAFPRAKVCGEFISPAATPLLESLLSPADLAAGGARRVRACLFEIPGRSIRWAMPTAAWVLSRRVLDDALLDRARDAGVEVVQPARVARVAYRDDGVCAHLSNGQTIQGDVVIHADGVGRHDLAGATPMRRGVVAMKCLLSPCLGASLRGLRMRSCEGAYIGSVGVEDGHTTLALVARTSVVKRFAGDGDALLRELWAACDPAWRVGPWLSCGVAGSGYITPGHARSFRVGNAAAAIEPVGGEGIGMALWSGHTLAHDLGSALGSLTRFAHRADMDVLRCVERRFASRYRARLRLRRPACLAAASLLMRPNVCKVAWPVLGARMGGGRRAGGAALAMWYALTGKPMGR